MFNLKYKIFVISLVALFISSGLVVMDGGSSNGSSGKNVAPSISWSKQVLVFIDNNMSTPTPSSFNERIVVNSSEYSSYENANLSNVFFSNKTSQIIPSWLQSGNSNSDNNTTYWLRLNTSIGAHSTHVIYMDFGNLGGINFGPYTGEAPQLSQVYGQYDDGANVFNFYDNFSGTSLNTKLWNAHGSSNIQVDNGISFTQPSAITSQSQYSSPGISEAFGAMSNPSTYDSTSYYLGGVGYGAKGMNGVSPVITTGWAENSTNSLGLTVFTGTGPYPYTYNISKSVDTSAYHVFGTGYINNTYTTGMIDNRIANSSSVNLGISSDAKLNVTLGFQSHDFPQSNRFYWVFEANTTSTGVNLPSQVGGYTITFTESGLPSGDLWGFSIDNLSGMRGVGGYNYPSTETLLLPNGHFNYTVYSGTLGYVPNNSTGSLTVNGAPLTVDFKFVKKTYTVSLIESGLPAGSNWSASFSGQKFSSTGSMLNATLPNGTYYVNLPYSNGYEPYPTSGVVTVFGANLRPEVIRYESPQNQSYLRSVGTINPISRVAYSGLNISSYTNPLSTSVAVDQKNGLLFIAGDSSSGNITVMNTTTGIFTQNLSMGKDTYPNGLYFDAHNGYLYATLDNGNLSIIDPGTLSVLKVVPVPQLNNSYIYVLPSETSDNIYVYGGDAANLTNATVYTISPGGKVLSEVNLSEIYPFYLPYGSPFVDLSPPIYHQQLIAPSANGIVVANVTTGAEKFIASPSGYVPVDAVPYGQAGNYIVSNGNGNSNMTFNVSALSWSSGPNLTGAVLAYAYDGMTGTYYYGSYNVISGNGNITAVDPGNGDILATAPSLIPSESIAFSPQSQSIYVMEAQALFSAGLVREYSVKHAYQVSLSETGLPSGASWYDNITGESSSGAISASSAYTTILVNGTYSFSYGTSDPQYRGSTGAFTVSGSSVSVSIKFSPVLLNISFLEKGLAPGVEWYLNLSGGNDFHSASQWINVSLMNGTYSYTVTSSSYLYTAKSGNLTVHGAAASPVDVNFTKIQAKAPPVSGNILIIAGGSAAVIAVIGSMVYILRRKRG